MSDTKSNIQVKETYKYVNRGEHEDFYFKGSKNAMKICANSKSEPQTAFLQYHIDGHRTFTFFPNWTIAYDKLPYVDDRRYINELLCVGRPVKGYLDIEKKYDKQLDDEYICSFIITLKDDIIAIIKNDYGYDIIDDNIKLLDSCGFTSDNKWKLSFHVIITTKSPQLLFISNRKQDVDSAFSFAYRLHGYKPIYSEYVDLSVYSSDRELRIINSYKSYTDLRQLTPYGNPTNLIITDYIISDYNLNDSHVFLKPKFIYDITTAKKAKSVKFGVNITKITVNIDNSFLTLMSTQTSTLSQITPNKPQKPKKPKKPKKHDDTHIDTDIDTDTTINTTTPTIIEPTIKPTIKPTIEPTTMEIIIDMAKVDKFLTIIKENIHATSKHTHTVIDSYGVIIYSFNYEDRAEPCLISDKNLCHEQLGFYCYEDDKNRMIVRCRSFDCNHTFKIFNHTTEIVPNVDLTIGLDNFIYNNHTNNDDDNDDDNDELTDINSEMYLSSAVFVNVQKLTDSSKSIKYTIQDSLNGDLALIDDHQKIRTMINNWITSNTKTISFSSCMDSGKTTLLTSILTEHVQFNRILFLTNRRSLAHAISGNFKSFGFKNYLNDPIINQDKVICQVDSILKLIDDDDIIPNYDLIIFDECESLLMHFNASTLKNRRKIFTVMQSMMKKSNKLIALDADYGDRSHTFFRMFGNTIVIKNDFKLPQKHFKYINNPAIFTNFIDDDLKNGLNVCIVSMNSEFIMSYGKDLTDRGISVMIHTKLANDMDNNKLINVNEFWINYQIVMYSPIIGPGLSFDVEHFDKIYCIMSDKSTSPRELFQMLGRIRHVKSNQIITLIEKRSFNIQQNANLCTYQQARDYMTYVSDDDNMSHIIIDLPDGRQKIVNAIDGPFEQILIYNHIEEFNKGRYRFIPTFLRLCAHKGHTFSALDNSVNETTYVRNKKKDSLNRQKIIDALDVSSDDISYLIYKNNNGLATSDEKCSIDKYVIKSTWGVDILTSEFMDNFFNKEYILHNLTAFIDESKINRLDNDSDRNKDMRRKIHIVKDIISKMGYLNIHNIISKNWISNVSADQAILTEDLFLNNIKIVIKDSLFFKDYKKNRILFKLTELSDDDNDTDYQQPAEWTGKTFMRTINAVLKHYGFVIKNIQDNKGKGGVKCSKINKYHLIFKNDIIKYVKL